MTLWVLLLALSLMNIEHITAQGMEAGKSKLINKIKHENEISPSFSIFWEFLKETQTKYFPECPLIIFQGGEYQHLKDRTIDTADEKIYFSLQLDFKDLENIKLYLMSQCLVYITLARNLTSAIPFFSLIDKKWDRYFLSRKHIIFTESPTEEMNNFLKAGETNTMINLLMVNPYKSTSLQVFTNKPYEIIEKSGIRRLQTWPRHPALPSVDFFPDKLSNLNGYPMHVVTFTVPPKIFLRRQPDGAYEVYGIDIMVVKILAEALNFTMNITGTSDGELWGWRINGSFTGLIGDLQFRRTDIGVANLFWRQLHLQYFDMSIYYNTDFLTFVTHVPQPYPQWMALQLPFAAYSWIGLIITTFIGMILFILVNKLAASMSPRDDTNMRERLWFSSSSNSVLILFRLVMNKDWVFEPDRLYLRLFLALWSFAYFIIGVSYQASLFSFLTIPLNSPLIDKYEQLYQEGIPVGGVGKEYALEMAGKADPYVKGLAEEKYTTVSSREEGFRKTSEGKFAYVEGRGVLEYIVAINYTNEQGQKSLHVMREYITPYGVGLGVPKYVPYTSKFDYYIRKMTEAGLQSKWIADAIYKSRAERIKNVNTDKNSASSTETSSDGPKPLTLNNLQGGFILLLLGICASCVVAAVECAAGHLINKIN